MLHRVSFLLGVTLVLFRLFLLPELMAWTHHQCYKVAALVR